MQKTKKTAEQIAKKEKRDAHIDVCTT